jgi:hypothetical protein
MPHDWKADVDRLRSTGIHLTADILAETLAKICGKPCSIRETRRRLFSVTVAALSGRPTLIDLDGKITLLTSLEDLAELLSENSLQAVLEKIRRNGPKRRRLVRPR